jgi:O-antigen ligase
MIMIVLSERDRLHALKRLLARTGFLLIPLSVLFIKYYPALAVEYKQWSGKAMYSGITTTKNLLGAICLIFGVGSLWRILASYKFRNDPHNVRHMIAHAIILVMAVWLLRTCDSMTSLSCLVLAGSLLTASSFRFLTRRLCFIHFLVAAAVSCSFATLFSGAGAGTLESMGRDPTLTGRTAIWELVLKLAGNPLIGTGFESFWMGGRLAAVWSVMPGIQEAHNGYIEVYLNLGWIGSVLLAITVAAGYQSVIARIRQDSIVGRLCLAYFLIGIVYNFTEAGFRMLFIVWIFFLLAIVADPKTRRLHRDTAMFVTQTAKLVPLS